MRLHVAFEKLMNLHRHDEADSLQGLLYIDYGFHVPLMIAAIVLAYSFIPIARGRMREGSPTVKGQQAHQTPYPRARHSRLTDAARPLRGPTGPRFP